MNKLFIGATCLMAIFSTTNSKTNVYTVQDLDYQIIWEDEFDGNSLNSEYWSIEQGGSSAWNNTAVDDPSVIEVSDGTLKLKAIKNPNYTGSLSSVGDINKNSI